jgi:hypothetical protein
VPFSLWCDQPQEGTLERIISPTPWTCWSARMPPLLGYGTLRTPFVGTRQPPNGAFVAPLSLVSRPSGTAPRRFARRATAGSPCGRGGPLRAQSGTLEPHDLAEGRVRGVRESLLPLHVAPPVGRLAREAGRGVAGDEDAVSGVDSAHQKVVRRMIRRGSCCTCGRDKSRSADDHGGDGQGEEGRPSPPTSSGPSDRPARASGPPLRLLVRNWRGSLRPSFVMGQYIQLIEEGIPFGEHYSPAEYREGSAFS